MCLIFISINDHPKYKLIVAANRDEFYRRKTSPAGYWQDNPVIVGGRDLEAQGTWMGVTTNGKVSMVTNFRDPANIDPNAPSRGHLVSDFLGNAQGAQEYLKEVSLKAGLYNGFNLILGKVDELYYFSNYQNKIIKLAPGLYGLSNHLLDTDWPKVTRGKEKMKALLNERKIDKSQLFNLLSDTQIAADDQLPRTGISLERERALSAMFIKTPDYGSRCSTLILIDNEGNMEFTERLFDLNDFSFTERTYQWKIPASRN